MQKILSILFLLSSFIWAETYFKGLIYDDEAYEKTPTTAKLLTRDLVLLPSSSSLKAYAPKVGSQGQTGTCTAWATAYGARTILESITQHRLNKALSSNNVFSPSYVYNQIRRYQGSNNGTSNSNILMA